MKPDGYISAISFISMKEEFWNLKVTWSSYGSPSLNQFYWELWYWDKMSIFCVDWSILLLLQVQRIPDYEKYLSDLLEDTDPQHPDYEDLSKAANRAKTVSQR